MTQAQPTPSNTPAAISLVAGLLSCVPGSGIVALIAGILGLKRARRGGVGGFVMSGLGMMLGMTGTVAWIVLPLTLYQEAQLARTRPIYIEAQRKFLIEQIAGNISTAKQYCSQDIDEDRLTDLLEQFRSFGELHEVRSGTGGDDRDPAAVQSNAIIVFTRSTQNFTGIWKTIDGQPRLADYSLQTTDADPSTQPTGR